MNADPTNHGVPRDRPPMDGDPTHVALCSGCRRPLTRTGPGGECLRCLLGFALSTDEEPTPAAAVDEAAASAPGRQPSLAPPPLRYGQFEVAVGFDGLPVELGAGAMAVTYRAHDTVLDSTVALKVINRTLAEHPAARARFLREARAAARLHHPNVASVTHYGEQEGECYYAMELVEGETLEAKVRRDGPMPVALVLEVGVQVARALAAAEACGVVHRDLKPSNLMLTAPQGEKTGGSSASTVVKVIDWGLAKAVSAESALGIDHTHGGFVGTPAFASPEQFSRADDRRIDTRSDIYSLGVTLWYLLCGRTPFVGSTLEEIHGSQVQSPLPLAQLAAARVPGRIVTLLKAMLAVDLAARPQSARELLVALRRCQEQFPLEAEPRRGRHRLRRAVTALVLLAASMAGWRQLHRAPPAPVDPSVAVLPFENLSPDEADTVFTAGMQNEITRDLSLLDSLKVTSPDSTKQYPPGPRDLVAIGRELGVAHLLQGSIRRAAGRVDVRLSLTAVRDLGRPWTHEYHRPVAEILDLRGEILRMVANRLQAAIPSAQVEALSRPPTHDPVAYDLYLRTNNTADVVTAEAARLGYKQKIAMLEEAVARDPNFTLAYCRMAILHDYIWTQVNDPAQPEVSAAYHRARAEEALQKACALEPDSGEVHFALANHAQYVRDQPRAAAEADLACQRMPNSARAANLAGRIDMRCNRWDSAIPRLERAVALDPFSLSNLYALGDAYSCLRRDDDADRVYTRMIDRLPTAEKPELILEMTLRKVSSRADLPALRVALDRTPPKADPNGNLRFKFGLLLRLFEGDGVAADAVLAAGKDHEFEVDGDIYPKDWFAALAANLRHDPESAQESFAAARSFWEKAVADHPGSSWRLSYLAMVDAALGRKEEAVREGLRACEMATYEERAQSAAVVRCNLAVIYAWTGQADLAFDVLGKATDRSAGFGILTQPTYGDLLLNPVWQSLRSDPRFEALVKRLAPSPIK